MDNHHKNNGFYRELSPNARSKRTHSKQGFKKKLDVSYQKYIALSLRMLRIGFNFIEILRKYKMI